MLCKVTEGKIPLSLALYDYRNTHIVGIGLSPAQMHLYHCLIKSKIPTHPDLLKSHVYADVPARLRARQHSQTCYYERSAGVLPELSPNQSFRGQHGNKWTPVIVVSKFDALRSYLLKTLDDTVYRRNGKHLRAVPSSSFNNELSGSGPEL
ncbi:hypothetical protein PR048_002302 [Dryococelus australis]|uniref:Uncharacterized protein n=1 Tax=Dryococelus australis TaxID=614101 RepID=A0ABQ9IJT4_9NEOP|nr:hypothetical protein PR048_002302 [Dryococelus australis]